MGKVILLFLNICLITTLLTGCWDRVDIDERGFVMAIGLDQTDEMLNLIYAIPNLPVITGTASGGEQDRYIKESSGKNLFEAYSELREITSRIMNFDHTKVVVFGHDLLVKGDKLKDVLDFFDRSMQFPMSLLVITTDGKAKELVETDVNSPSVTGWYIYEFFKNLDAGEELFGLTILKDLIVETIENEGSTRLPIMNKEGDEIAFRGIAFLKDYQYVNSVDDKQTIPYLWLRGKGAGSYVSTMYEQEDLPFAITEIKRSADFEQKEGGLKIRITIEVEGDVMEYYTKAHDDIFSDQEMKEIENVIEIKMKEEMTKIITFAQKDIGFDIFEFEDLYKIKEGKEYEKIKDDWDEYFVGATIHVDVIAYIRRIGMSR